MLSNTRHVLVPLNKQCVKQRWGGRQPVDSFDVDGFGLSWRIAYNVLLFGTKVSATIWIILADRRMPGFYDVLLTGGERHHLFPDGLPHHRRHGDAGRLAPCSEHTERGLVVTLFNVPGSPLRQTLKPTNVHIIFSDTQCIFGNDTELLSIWHNKLLSKSMLTWLSQ